MGEALVFISNTTGKKKNSVWFPIVAFKEERD
jgi:hypothetical protein